MDFALSSEQQMVVDTVRGFVERELYPLEDEVEPFLLRSELVVRTPRGRVVTAKTYEHLNLLPGQDDGGSAQKRLFE